MPSCAGGVKSPASSSLSTTGKDVATTIRANVMDGAAIMGDVKPWERFARDNGADPDAETSAPGALTHEEQAANVARERQLLDSSASSDNPRALALPKLRDFMEDHPEVTAEGESDEAVLGEGSYGEVLRMHRIRDNTDIVAVKCLKVKTIQGGGIDTWL